MDLCIICKAPENEDKLRNPNAGIKTIEEYCQLFKRDDIQSVLKNGTQNMKIHVSCQKKIGNDIRKKKRNDENEGIRNRKMKRRSEDIEPFDWKVHCLFCGKPAIEDEKKKHPERQNSSISHPGSHPDLKKRLLEICRRPDRLDSAVSHIVRGRLMATNDIVAEKCRYHRICYREFCRDCIPSDEAPVKRSGRPTNDQQTKNFEKLCEWLETETDMHTVSELHQKMVQLSNGTPVYTRNQYLKHQLQVRYGEKILFADINGKSDVLCFAKVATSVISKYKTETTMEGVVLENAYERNRSKRLVTKDQKAFAFKYAEENSCQSSDEEVNILKKASGILRKRTLQFIKDNPSSLNGFKTTDLKDQIPPELMLFVENLLFSQRQFDSDKSDERKRLTETVSSSIVYNIKSDRQVKYEKKRTSRSRHRFIPYHLVARALAIRHCERNNAVLQLLSAPNFGLSIPPETCLLVETMIANSMIKIAKNEGVYIPPNIERGTRVSFHIDNFDEQVQTFDGKNTVHYLLIVCFQRSNGQHKPIELNLEKAHSLQLADNSFSELQQCDEPTNRQFRRTPGCLNVTVSLADYQCRSPSIFIWQCLRSFEYFMLSDESATYLSDGLKTLKENDSAGIPEGWNLDSLCLPSFSATNSLIVDMDTTLTNIYPLPFVAGPASSISAVYTALDIAFRTGDAIKVQPTVDLMEREIEDIADENTFDHDSALDLNTSLGEILPLPARTLEPPPLWKSIIVLDLDLYAKAYKLVNSRTDLKSRYVLCLGELHIIFAEIRAIGTFIDTSGIDDAWISAKWFDSEALLRQVKECSNMKRAIATHEATLIALSILILQETIRWFDEQDWCNNQLLDTIKLAKKSMEEARVDNRKFREAWHQFKIYLSSIELNKKMSVFIKSNENNKLLQILVKYMEMVRRLFTFIEATRSRNWLLHLDAIEDMIPDFASMNRINYRRLAAAYVADMRYLKDNDTQTWNYFLEGNFCCQKNKIPFTAIGRDHCGEQENKVLKGRGGVSGQTSNANSTNRYFMVAPVLSQIYSDMLKEGGGSRNDSLSHHQLGEAYTKRQNGWVVSLLKTFEYHQVSLSSAENEPFRNIISGQIFPDVVYSNMKEAYENGQRMYEAFVEERLKPESIVGIFAPLKKSKVKTCKYSNKSAEIKYKDKVAILKEENLFISRIAMIRGSRDVDMKSHVGKYELSPIVHSLMRRDGTLYGGWDGKSELATRVLKEANLSLSPEVPSTVECVAIDAMFLMNQISTKPYWIKTGADLAKEFCNRLDQQTEHADSIVVGFEWYMDDSMKAMAWKSRKGNDKTIRNDYHLEPDTDLSKRCMKDILGTTATKRSLTKLLMEATVKHFKTRGVTYFIAGNGRTYSSFESDGTTNHTEGETAIILGLSTMTLLQKRVIVYGNDVDLFVLLLAHYKNIGCRDLYMKSLSGYTPITSVYEFLGEKVSSALLPFHALTGCDITGKFCGKTKDFWTGKFLSERSDSKFIDALLMLHVDQSADVLAEIEKFVCKAYCPKRTPQKVTNSLMETRYYLYKKLSSETSKLPPSHGAFREHVKRACCPLFIWVSANLRETASVNVQLYGWLITEGRLMPVSTCDEIAPEELVDLVSCKCNGDCSKGRCTCKRNNVACTDFCGCGDLCENTDMSPPETINDDLEDDIEDISDLQFEELVSEEENSE